MSLNFSLGKIVDASPEGMQWVWPEYNAETNPSVPMNPKVESMIFTTMNVGINKITEENAPSFYGRYLMLCRSLKHDPFFTVEDVFKTVGLSTNASSMTDAAFKKHLFSILEREVNWAVSQEMKAMNDASGLDELGDK